MSVATLENMTTIIGLENEHGCVLAADGQTTLDNWRFTHSDLKKIVEKNGYLIAASGESQACDIAAQLWSPPQPSKNLTWYEHAVRSLSASLRIAHENNGYVATKESEWSVIIAHSGMIAQIESDYSILRAHNGIYGIGSGSSAAVGALTALLPVFPVKDAMIESIRIAAMYDIYTSLPVHLETQSKGAALE